MRISGRHRTSVYCDMERQYSILPYEKKRPGTNNNIDAESFRFGMQRGAALLHPLQKRQHDYHSG